MENRANSFSVANFPLYSRAGSFKEIRQVKNSPKHQTTLTSLLDEQMLHTSLPKMLNSLFVLIFTFIYSSCFYSSQLICPSAIWAKGGKPLPFYLSKISIPSNLSFLTLIYSPSGTTCYCSENLYKRWLCWRIAENLVADLQQTGWQTDNLGHSAQLVTRSP